MAENETTQEGNVVLGDQAGRDVIKSSTYNFNNSQSSISTMQALLTKFKEEHEQNPALDKFIEELDYYNRPLDGDVIGLEQKLKDGKRENFIEYATRMKEAYHKKLHKYQFSEAAQKINLHFLALVEHHFMTQIYPRICDETDPNIVNTLVSDLIVKPLTEQLDENPLGLTAKEISGMIYFLTGNCHIKWNK